MLAGLSLVRASLRLHLAHPSGQPPPGAVAAAAAARSRLDLCRAMGSTPEQGAAGGIHEEKRRVREEVKAALRRLSQEQMAEESEWRLRAAELCICRVLGRCCCMLMLLPGLPGGLPRQAKHYRSDPAAAC